MSLGSPLSLSMKLTPVLSNSLSTPHEYDLTRLLDRGRNRISIRIDNRMIIPVGVNSHSVSDHTQSNWNGITGNISLVSTPRVYIEDIKVFPDINGKKAKIIVSIRNTKDIDFNGKLAIRAREFQLFKEENFLRKL